MNSLHSLESLLFAALRKWELIPVIREAATKNINRYMKMLYSDINEAVIDTKEILDKLSEISTVGYITSEVLIQEQKLPLFYKYIYRGVDILEDGEDEDKGQTLLQMDTAEGSNVSILDTTSDVSIIGATVKLEDFKKIVSKFRMQ